MNRFSHTVSADQNNLRIDRVLVDELKSLTRAKIQKWIENGLVYLNGTIAKSSNKVRTGDSIEIPCIPSEQPEIELQPWNYPVDILYEDPHIVAVNKPAHLVVHPGAGRKQETLANALVFHYPELRIVGHPARPGIVHRLDKETSGLLLLARSSAAYHALCAMFKDRTIEKHYRSAVWGKFDRNEGKIDRALGRDPKDRKKISIRARKSRTAMTLYRVLKRFDFGALLDVQILTGRTHQIRVHLSSENHPVIGDSFYGGGDWNRIQDAGLRNQLRAARFFGLHSFSLDFLHPVTGTPMHLSAPLPPLWRLLISSEDKDESPAR